VRQVGSYPRQSDGVDLADRIAAGTQREVIDGFACWAGPRSHWIYCGKPVALVADALRGCSWRGESVLDTVLGSGRP
jgi:hypothetical protein